jgi:preprotein translocase subunit SecF
LNTSITTLLVIVMLVIFGGSAIGDFAMALLIGILFGTYSSLFLAGPLWLTWMERKK